MTRKLGIAALAAACGGAWAFPALAQVPPKEPGVKLGMAYQLYAIDYLGDAPVAAGYPIGFHRVLFFPTGRLSPELTFKSRFAIDGFGVSGAGLGPGHMRTSTMDVGSPFYVDWAYASFAPTPQTTWHLGSMNLDRELTVGSAIKNPFDQPSVISIAMTRYGSPGTPALLPNGTLDAAPSRPANWLVGTNVAQETLDPASTTANFPNPGLSLVLQQRFGSARLSLATNNGVYGANPARAHDRAQARALTLPLNYPESPALYNGYSLALLENDFGGARLQVGLRADNNTMGTSQGKYSSLTVDAGDARLGGSVSIAGPGLPNERLGAFAWGTLPAGFGLGAALKANGMLGMTAGAYRFVSYGPMVRTPAAGWFPSWTLGVQQTNGPSGEALAAGYTVETSLRLHPALPLFNLEYSAGKYDPAGGNVLLDPSRPATHQVFAFITTFAF